MASVLEQFHKDVHDYVDALVLSKVLPAISAKWNIPLESLTTFVRNEQKSVAPKEKPTASPQKKVANSGGADLASKVADAKAQSKYYNVISGKLLNDTPANRKKYVFYKELGIAGIEGDPKTVKAIETLGSPAGGKPQVEEQPVPVEEESPALEEQEEQPVPVEEESPALEEQEEQPVPVKEESPAPAVKQSVGKDEKVAVSAGKEEQVDDVKEVVKLSEIVEEKVPEEPKISSRFNSKVRANVFLPLGFAYRKLSTGAIQIIGKVDSTGSKLLELSESDMKECKRRNWIVAFS